MDLKNAVVLITGGSSGIGRAAAEVFAQAGARVAITERDADRLAEAARSLGVVGIQADVANEADVMRTFREVKEKLGDLDVLINNAGIGVLKELIDQDRGSFDAVFATNGLPSFSPWEQYRCGKAASLTPGREDMCH
jgi:3-oxoacyl-[acyl-carrier protein] reductase